jgi:ectoine hydroxylase-related dioxygenase (phytanoyl-CoA dioxygenase family)
MATPSTQPTASVIGNWKSFRYEELESLDRDLQFHPSVVTGPKRLTPEQVASYNAKGYLTGIRVFSEEEADANRKYFDSILERTFAAGKDSYSISTAHRRYRGVHEMATDPRVLDYVGDILGDSFVLWGTHFFCKMPGDGKTVSWHQDASYWPLTPSKTVTLWLAIDDSDTGNGCMRVIPGSHWRGHLTWRYSESGENNVLDQTVEEATQYGDAPVDLILKAGEISMHTDLILHGSEPNRSDRRRCGLTMRYAATDVRAYMGWNEKGVVCRGSDPDGHWANYPPPEEY